MDVIFERKAWYCGCPTLSTYMAVTSTNRSKRTDGQTKMRRMTSGYNLKWQMRPATWAVNIAALSRCDSYHRFLTSEIHLASTVGERAWRTDWNLIRCRFSGRITSKYNVTTVLFRCSVLTRNAPHHYGENNDWKPTNRAAQNTALLWAVTTLILSIRCTGYLVTVPVCRISDHFYNPVPASVTDKLA